MSDGRYFSPNESKDSWREENKRPSDERKVKTFPFQPTPRYARIIITLSISLSLSLSFCISFTRSVGRRKKEKELRSTDDPQVVPWVPGLSPGQVFVLLFVNENLSNPWKR